MEYFIKVYINSKDDLPKEYGRYLTEFGWAKYDGSWTYSEMKGGGYLRDCYWYLKPVEIPEISDAEIEKYFKQWNSPRIKTADKQYEEWLNKYLDEIIDSAIIGAKWYRSELKKRMTK